MYQHAAVLLPCPGAGLLPAGGRTKATAACVSIALCVAGRMCSCSHATHLHERDGVKRSGHRGWLAGAGVSKGEGAAGMTAAEVERQWIATLKSPVHT